MKLLLFLVLALALYANIAALTLVVSRWLPSQAVARTAGLLGVWLCLFFIEHFLGLGRLHWTWPILLFASVFVLWRERERFTQRAFIRREALFLMAAAYVIAWKAAFPEIVEDNDRLTDLHLIANYLPGDRLPPVDFWLPWQHLDYYYAFQQYGASLLGRVMGLGPGASFNLGIVLIFALAVTLAWEFLAALGARLWAKALAVFCLVMGGTGLSPFFHLIVEGGNSDLYPGSPATETIYRNSRFIGWFDDTVASSAWHNLFGTGSTPRGLQLPIETFGMQVLIGGYHAPLSGFLLLFLALALIALLRQPHPDLRPRYEFLLGLSVPLTLCSNAWVFPLQGVLVGAWKLWDGGIPRPRELAFLAAGAALGLVLLAPFLAGFAIHGHGMQLTRVLSEQRTPLAQFLLLHWPLLLLAALAPFAGRQAPLALLFAAVFVPLLVGTELVNAFDGSYGGDFARFNPALKWWGWIFTGGFLALSGCLLASERWAIRVLTVACVLMLSLFAVDVGRYWLLRPKPYAGKMDGTGFYAADPSNARLLAYLTNADSGLLLEPVYDQRPIDTGIYGSFAGKPDLVGIPWVLKVWRSGLTELPGLVSDIQEFYAGRLAEPLRFLTGHDVSYVLWSVRESKDREAWTAIDQAISPGYHWMEFSADPGQHIGAWVRNGPSLAGSESGSEGSQP
jgi:uncharacterized membrane protein